MISDVRTGENAMVLRLFASRRFLMKIMVVMLIL